ncbi:AAA family ATPase [Pseudomonas gingeri]
MIFSLLLRNFKTYQGINYIALSNSSKLSALVGENGAGKSSVLEALNSYFNNSDWNYNHNLSKGFQEREPFICPLFLIEKSKIPTFKNMWLINKLSEMTWEAKAADFNPSGKLHAELFTQQRAELKKFLISKDTHYLFPFGIIKANKSATSTIYYSIFETLPAYAALKNYNTYLVAISELQKHLQTYYNYIYLPSELNFRDHTKLESKTMQALLGQKIDQIVRGLINKSAIIDINNKLGEFLDTLSSKLVHYEYRKPALKQSLVNLTHFTDTIIDSYFGSKVLSKKAGKDSSVPGSDMSSGEKRQALLDVAQAFLTSSSQPENQQTILAIDEPELSLHVSACFSQFEKLKDVSEAGVQVLATTHWYGFMPIVSNGVAIYCPKTEGEPVLLDLRCFRDELKKLKVATSGRLPTELELKGTNDLVQSIIASITAASYKWIICEGAADKIYLDHYLKKENYLVVAVGGSFALKKIFTYIDLALSEAKDDIQGKIFFLLDTDKKYERFESKDSIDGVRIRRIKNNEETQRTDLLHTNNNDFHPATVIEDTLIPSYFLKTLCKLKDEGVNSKIIGGIVEGMASQDDNMPPSFSLNLRKLEQKALDDLFAMDGFKITFALKYIEVADSKKIPSWIEEIKEFLSTPRKRRQSQTEKTTSTSEKINRKL